MYLTMLWAEMSETSYDYPEAAVKEAVQFARRIINAADPVLEKPSVKEAFAFSVCENTRFERVLRLVSHARLNVDVTQDPAGNVYFSTKGHDDSGGAILYGGTLDTPREDQRNRGSVGPAIGLASILLRQKLGLDKKDPRGIAAVLWRGGSQKPYYLPNMGVGLATGRLTEATLQRHGLLAANQGRLFTAFAKANLPPSRLSLSLAAHQRLIPINLVNTYFEFTPDKNVGEPTLVSERNHASVVSYDPVIFTSMIPENGPKSSKTPAAEALRLFTTQLNDIIDPYRNFLRVDLEAPEAKPGVDIASIKSIGFHSHSDPSDGRETIGSILPKVVASLYPEIARAAADAGAKANAAAFMPGLETFISVPYFERDHFLNDVVPEVCGHKGISLGTTAGSAIPDTAVADFRRMGMNSAAIEVPSAKDGCVSDADLEKCLSVAAAVNDGMFGPARSRFSGYGRPTTQASFGDKIVEFLNSPPSLPRLQPGKTRKSRHPA